MLPEIIAASDQVRLSAVAELVLLGASHVASGALAVICIKAAEGVYRHLPRVRVRVTVERRRSPEEE